MQSLVSCLRLRLAFVVVALGAAAAWFWYYHVRATEDTSHLVLEGNIDVRQVNLSFKVEGRIASLAVDEGDTVEVGAVVAVLDKRYFEDDLRLNRARRDNAAAALARLENGSRPEEIAEARRRRLNSARLGTRHNWISTEPRGSSEKGR